jgi:biopolymer transport protein ExbD
VLLNGSLASRADVENAVKRAIRENPDTQAVISADRETLHGDVVRVIDWIKTAGLERFAVQIEREADAR